MKSLPVTTEILSGHVSPETAYVVSDYPYGFTFRCQIRYWLEHNKKGTRFVSQTSNPKVAGTVWNKPKASTYADAGALYLDDQDYVQWSTVSFSYDSAEDLRAWREKFGASLPAEVLAKLNHYVDLKTVYEAELARGEFQYGVCARIASAHLATKKPLEELRAKVREILAKQAAEKVQQTA